jgi:hypothetical protein
MINWAGKNLSPEEVSTYNSAIASGKKPLIRLVLSGLQAKYAHNGTRPPAREVQGASRPSASFGKGYAHPDEMIRDMQNPRYAAEESFRAQVDRKLKESHFS